MDDLIEEVVPGRESVMAQIVRRAVGRGEVDPDKLTERIIRFPADLFRHEVTSPTTPPSHNLKLRAEPAAR